ncbi:MAG: cytochrome-c peroxidase [Acidobacteria bacterium]|nr:cytochrome-c peroxidase [Acidobacteriota bacterium]
MRPGIRFLEALLLITVGLFSFQLGCKRAEEKAAAPPAYQPEVPALPPAPPGFEEMPIPADNPMTAEKVALGRQLFFDKRLSADGSRSCYSCHVCENGLTDGLPTAVGALGKKLTRSSPTLWNIGYHKEYYWDGRSASLEKQALAAWSGANMGAKPEEVVATLNAIPGYKDQFQRVFASEGTPEHVIKALAAFERTLYCGTTPFDKFQQGDQTAISEDARKGWEVFRQSGCGTCHAGILFTDLQYHNVGIGMDAPQPDVGRQKVSNVENETGAFKTPTLRDISRSAPYFHDGSVATLEEAVDLMAGGGKPNKYLDRKNLRKAAISAKQKEELLAFLRSLDCECDLTEPKLPN